jgi:hypothetical protein
MIITIEEFKTIAYIIKKRQWKFLKHINNFDLENEGTGEYILTYFAKRDDIKAIDFLLTQNVDINVINHEGDNIFQIASKNGHISLIDHLSIKTSFNFNLSFNSINIPLIEQMKRYWIKYKILPILFSYKKGYIEEPWNMLCLDWIKYILKLMINELSFTPEYISYKTRAGLTQEFLRDIKSLWNRYNLTFEDKVITNKGEATIVGFAKDAELCCDKKVYLWFDICGEGASYWEFLDNKKDFDTLGFRVL